MTRLDMLTEFVQEIRDVLRPDISDAELEKVVRSVMDVMLDIAMDRK